MSTHIPHIGPYNTQPLLAFLNQNKKGLVRPDLPIYVVVWDNVSFHQTNIVREWSAAHERITMEFLPPYSPFLNQRSFFPRCITRENIRRDVDENLWPDQQERQDVHQEFFSSWMSFCGNFLFSIYGNVRNLRFKMKNKIGQATVFSMEACFRH